MIAIRQNVDSLKAIGYTSSGKRKEYKIGSSGILFCYNEDLINLEIPDGVEKIDCSDNLLSELYIPNSIKIGRAHV